MHIVKCAMWYIIPVTAVTNLLDATTGLQLCVLLQKLLSFTLIFHLQSIMIGGILNFKNLYCFFNFLIFAFMFVHSKPTKIMFVDTKYKNRKQIL